MKIYKLFEKKHIEIMISENKTNERVIVITYFIILYLYHKSIYAKKITFIISNF